MTPPLLANENFPLPAVRALRALGCDVLSLAETMPGSSDEAVLELARREGRWLMTFDRDYGELVFLRRLPPPPAILFLRQEPVSPARPGEIIAAMLRDPARYAGQFVVVGETSVRLRALPGRP